MASHSVTTKGSGLGRSTADYEEEEEKKEEKEEEVEEEEEEEEEPKLRMDKRRQVTANRYRSTAE
jgi:hypothetical protein